MDELVDCQEDFAFPDVALPSWGRRAPQLVDRLLQSHDDSLDSQEEHASNQHPVQNTGAALLRRSLPHHHLPAPLAQEARPRSD